MIRFGLVALWLFICQFFSALPIANADERRQFTENTNPNIILINLDDADVEMMSSQMLKDCFPNISKLASQGLQLTNLHVTTPLCGPSRACLLRGQYAHRCGIYTNDPIAVRSNGFPGGMKTYQENGHLKNDLSTWMNEAGYHTAIVGKYLHGNTLDIVPDGWDEFYTSRGANYFGTARFTNRDNKDGKYHQEELTTYRTATERDETLGIMARHFANSDKPLFLYLAPLAPHHHTPHDNNGMVEKQYLDFWKDMKMPLGPDFMEADFDDKSTAIRDVKILNGKQSARLIESYRDRVLSMKSVDDTVGEIVESLTRRNQLENTYIVLTSDNGFSNGHHRLIGKGDSFDRSTRVPTIVYGPNVAVGAKANHLLAHIDLAPTILDLAGASAEDDLDGKSFASLLSNPESIEPDSWRDAIIIENWESRFLNGKLVNTANVGLRLYDSVYVQWANGTDEYYDLTTDPLQVTNTIDTLDSSRLSKFQAKLMDLRKIESEPSTTISQPFSVGGFQGRHQSFVGMAEARHGIDSVTVSVSRLSDHKYWDGEKWSIEKTTRAATITKPGQQLTTWSLPCEIVPERLDEIYTIQAIANSADETDPSPAVSVFYIDNSRPIATIASPEKDGMIVEKFRVAGWVADQGVVKRAQVVIRNRTENEYWTGDEWTKHWSSFEIPVRPSGRFSYSVDGFHGNYYVSVRAIDLSGNQQMPAAKIKITVLNPDFE